VTITDAGSVVASVDFCDVFGCAVFVFDF